MKSGAKLQIALSGIYLSDLQKLGLCQAEHYGWHLADTSINATNHGYILIIDKENHIGLLKDDGSVETDVDIDKLH